MGKNKSILEEYKEDIKRLLSEGYGSGKISSILRSEKGIDTSPSSVKRIIKKYGLRDDIVTETQVNNKVLDKDWSIAWIKEKGISLMIKNPKGENVKPLEEIRDDFKKEMSNYSPKYKKIDYKPVKDPHCLIIDIADLHIGKLATLRESGNTYNSKLAIERARKGVAGILSKSSGFELDKIIFIIGNDVLHTDTTKRTTTSGTAQDTDGMWYDNFVLARQLYCSVIESLALIAPVHVVHNPSNHDFMSGFMLADSVYSWFNKHPNVTFDVNMRHRKYTQYGSSMIATSHGDAAKLDNLPYLAAHEEPKMWAETKHRYAYLHHVHHKDLFKFRSGKDFIGMTVEYMRSPSGTDGWHHRQGYTGIPKAIEAVVHSKDRGQVARITHIFD